MKRLVFADGFNSAVHFILGLLSGMFRSLTLAFLFFTYQTAESTIMHDDDENYSVDMSEFGIGVILGLMLYWKFY